MGDHFFRIKHGDRWLVGYEDYAGMVAVAAEATSKTFADLIVVALNDSSPVPNGESVAHQNVQHNRGD